MILVGFCTWAIHYKLNSEVCDLDMTINLATLGVGRRGNEKWRRGEGSQGRGEGCEDGVRKRGRLRRTRRAGGTGLDLTA